MSGPAGAPSIYGHDFAFLVLLATHETWGTIALTVLSRLYALNDEPVSRLAGLRLSVVFCPFATGRPR
jgi:hypothetical protein